MRSVRHLRPSGHIVVKLEGESGKEYVVGFDLSTKEGEAHYRNTFRNKLRFYFKPLERDKSIVGKYVWLTYNVYKGFMSDCVWRNGTKKSDKAELNGFSVGDIYHFY